MTMTSTTTTMMTVVLLVVSHPAATVDAEWEQPQQEMTMTVMRNNWSSKNQQL